jgi:cytochrome c-type biogenesis protein CcmH
MSRPMPARQGIARALAAVFATILLAGAAVAVEPDEILPDAALEARARHISAGLRCLVCQNQSIDDSNAPLARDLRLLVRERLKAGDSDAQVTRFVEDRYGEFVLLRPPFEVRTLVLWIAPLLVLLAALAVAVRAFGRSRASPAAAALTNAEEEKLRALLARDESSTPAD